MNSDNNSNKSLSIDPELYASIEEMIANPESVVGIDAKKTHIFIIQKLVEIEARLKQIEDEIKANK